MLLRLAVALAIGLLLGLEQHHHRDQEQPESRQQFRAFDLADPWDAFNPYHIWWMVVLVAAISYVPLQTVLPEGLGARIGATR